MWWQYMLPGANTRAVQPTGVSMHSGLGVGFTNRRFGKQDVVAIHVAQRKNTRCTTYGCFDAFGFGRRFYKPKVWETRCGGNTCCPTQKHALYNLLKIPPNAFTIDLGLRLVRRFFVEFRLAFWFFWHKIRMKGFKVQRFYFFTRPIGAA